MKSIADLVGGVVQDDSSESVLDRLKNTPYSISESYSLRYDDFRSKTDYWAQQCWGREYIFSDDRKDAVASYCVKLEDDILERGDVSLYDGSMLIWQAMINSVTNDNEMKEILRLGLLDELKDISYRLEKSGRDKVRKLQFGRLYPV